MDNPKVSVRRTRKYGKGVFAKMPIRKGEVVAIFDGPIFDDDFNGWTKDLQNHAIQIGPGLWRDSKGLARWINHSCEPNCGIKGLVKVVAMRRIEAGEQITWDYEMTEKSDWWRMRCRCGTESCRRWIGNYANMPQAVRRRYSGYISEWLIERRSSKRR